MPHGVFARRRKAIWIKIVWRFPKFRRLVNIKTRHNHYCFSWYFESTENLFPLENSMGGRNGRIFSQGFLQCLVKVWSWPRSSYSTASRWPRTSSTSFKILARNFDKRSHWKILDMESVELISEVWTLLFFWLEMLNRLKGERFYSRTARVNFRAWVAFRGVASFSTSCRPGRLSFPHILKIALMTSTHWPHQRFELLSFIVHPSNA